MMRDICGYIESYTLFLALVIAIYKLIEMREDWSRKRKENKTQKKE
jgi:hypothetical protein